MQAQEWEQSLNHVQVYFILFRRDWQIKFLKVLLTFKSEGEEEEGRRGPQPKFISLYKISCRKHISAVDTALCNIPVGALVFLTKAQYSGRNFIKSHLNIKLPTWDSLRHKITIYLVPSKDFVAWPQIGVKLDYKSKMMTIPDSPCSILLFQFQTPKINYRLTLVSHNYQDNPKRSWKHS